MKLSYNWLKDYISVSIAPEVLSHRLTMAGLEVKGIEKIGDDTVFELEITPNRADCLNVIGMAREVSAIFNKPLKLPKVSKIKSPPEKCKITIQDKSGCLRYIGTLIKDVHVSQSSGTVEKNLTAIGLRAINNVVDITNFCLMEMGQPLHAFDYDKLIGGKIIVRRANPGETITTIDDTVHELDPSILVIADTQRPVAIAGIMGGKDTEVTHATKNILLESAYFDPVLIRRAARSLGLSSDSAYRFERGVDMENVMKGAQRAASLICQHTKGNIQAFVDVDLKKIKKIRREITVDTKKIDSLLGVSTALSRLKSILEKLGFNVTVKKSVLKIQVPSFRNDISCDVDIIEEIARIIGYDTFPVSLPQIKVSNIQENKERGIRENLAGLLTAQGLHEAINYAMISQKNIEKSNLNNSYWLRVHNPLTVEQEIMRPSLLPGLLTSVVTNLSRGQKDIRLFEIGKVYSSQTPTEKETLGVIMTGKRSLDWRKSAKEDIDFYDIKGVVEESLKKIGIVSLKFVPNRESFLEAGKSASIEIDGTAVGLIGNIADRVLNQWDIKQKNILFAEIDLEIIYSHTRKDNAYSYRAIGEFPAVVRDISLAVKGSVTYEDIKHLASQMKCNFLSDIRLIEQYLGDKLPKGYRGLTVSLTYQSPAKTLREEEVNQVHDRFCRAVVDQLGAIQR